MQNCNNLDDEIRNYKKEIMSLLQNATINQPKMETTLYNCFRLQNTKFNYLESTFQKFYLQVTTKLWVVEGMLDNLLQINRFLGLENILSSFTKSKRQF